MDRQRLEKKLAQFPLFEYAFVEEKDLIFSDQVRYICKTECAQYGKSWSCPPAVGTVAECEARCSRFEKGFLFTTVAEAEDICNLEATLAMREDHEEITRQIRDLFLSEGCETLTLSTESCSLCKRCSYPQSACRHPDKMFPCVESYGILVTNLAERCGMTFMSGGNIVTWFSLILYR